MLGSSADGNYDSAEVSLATIARSRDRWLAFHPLITEGEYVQISCAHCIAGNPPVARAINPRSGVADLEAFVCMGRKNSVRNFSPTKSSEVAAEHGAIEAADTLSKRYLAGRSSVHKVTAADQAESVSRALEGGRRVCAPQFAATFGDDAT